jgi:hypothetical protein
MDVPTRSSSTARRNDAARGALLLGLVGVAVPIAGYVAARQLDKVTIVHATAVSCASAVLGIAAIVLGRRGQRNVERTLGRLGGGGTARAGRLLGFLSLCLGLIAALALGVYELLNYLG